MKLFSKPLATDPATVGPRFSLSAASERFAKLSEKRQDLLAEKQKLGEEGGELARQVRNVLSGNDQSAIERTVGDLIPKSGAPNRSAMASRYDEICNRMQDLQAGADALYLEIEKERVTASVKICADVRDEYYEKVHQICVALLQVHDALVDYRSLTDELSGAGVNWSILRNMSANWIGQPNYNQTNLACYLQEAEQYGFISRQEIPEKLRR